MYYYNPTVTSLLFMVGVPIFIYGVGIINIAIVMETSRIMSRQTWLYEEKNDIIESYKCKYYFNNTKNYFGTRLEFLIRNYLMSLMSLIEINNIYLI